MLSLRICDSNEVNKISGDLVYRKVMNLAVYVEDIVMENAGTDCEHRSKERPVTHRLLEKWKMAESSLFMQAEQNCGNTVLNDIADLPIYIGGYGFSKRNYMNSGVPLRANQLYVLGRYFEDYGTGALFSPKVQETLSFFVSKDGVRDYAKCPSGSHRLPDKCAKRTAGAVGRH